MSSLAGVVQSLGLSLMVLVALLRTLAYLLRDKQAQLLYFPDQPADSRTDLLVPAQYGLRAENLEVETEDGVKLRCFFLYCPDGHSDVTIVHFHGNAGNIGHRLPMGELLTSRLKVNLVLAEYRGYGFSDDAPGGVTEDGLLKDAVAVVDHVRALPFVQPDSVFVHGSSLGGAVAVNLAARHPTKLAGVMLENTFTSISDMADVLLASILRSQQGKLSSMQRTALSTLLLSVIKPICIQLHWRSIDKIAAIQIPILFISGSDDELVPPEHMARLYAKCRSQQKKIARVVGGQHNDTYRFDEAVQGIRDFLTELSPSVEVHTDAAQSHVDTSTLAQAPQGRTQRGSGGNAQPRRHAATRSSENCDMLV